MTIALAHAVDRVDLPKVPGLSTRTLRQSLKMFAKLAQADGTMRYGFSASKLQLLLDISERVAKRVRAALEKLGYIINEYRGGGRKAAKWRLNLELLGVESHPSGGEVAPQPARPGTPQRPTRVFASINQRLAGLMRNDVARHVPPEDQCRHGFDGSSLPSGQPRCPVCRRTRAPKR